MRPDASVPTGSTAVSDGAVVDVPIDGTAAAATATPAATAAAATVTTLRPLRVAWVGLRGFPGVQGGVEAHAEQLCPRLAALGCEVTVYARRGYQDERIGPWWKGVRLRTLWAPRHKHLEAVVHTFLAITHAALLDRPDLLHIQAIGPALWTPWARLLGLRVVVTHHGEDYRRQKWGALARTALRCGEACAVAGSHELIVISRTLRDGMARGWGRDAELISNGITPVAGDQDSGSAIGSAAAQASPPPPVLQRLALQPRRYVLLVSRMVAEKRHADLIQAFAQAQAAGALPGWKLALVGAADHADGYSRGVAEAAARVPDVVMAGLQTGQALAALQAHAGLFVLPSSHEGLPIVLLEALAHGVPVLASDIAPHRELGLPARAYFPVGDVQALAMRLQQAAEREESEADRAARRRWVGERYSWDRSARQTQQVYARVLGGPWAAMPSSASA